MAVNDEISGYRHQQTELGLIMENFPLKAHTIESLYGEDADFRSLCDDYFLCDQTLKRLQHELGDLQIAIKEYQDTFLDLEREISHWISKPKG